MVIYIPTPNDVSIFFIKYNGVFYDAWQYNSDDFKFKGYSISTLGTFTNNEVTIVDLKWCKLRGWDIDLLMLELKKEEAR